MMIPLFVQISKSKQLLPVRGSLKSSLRFITTRREHFNITIWSQCSTMIAIAGDGERSPKFLLSVDILIHELDRIFHIDPAHKWFRSAKSSISLQPDRQFLDLLQAIAQILVFLLSQISSGKECSLSTVRLSPNSPMSSAIDSPYTSRSSSIVMLAPAP